MVLGPGPVSPLCRSGSGARSQAGPQQMGRGAQSRESSSRSLKPCQIPWLGRRSVHGKFGAKLAESHESHDDGASTWGSLLFGYGTVQLSAEHRVRATLSHTLLPLMGLSLLGVSQNGSLKFGGFPCVGFHSNQKRKTCPCDHCAV